VHYALDLAAHAGPSADGVERCHYCLFPWDGPHDEGCQVKAAWDLGKAELDALLSAPVVSPPEPTCANCLHLWYAHVNSGHIGECRDVVSDGSRCGCTRFEAAAPVVSGWQPIETAPKDSSPILATKPGWVTPRLMCWLDGVALGKPGWRLFDNNPEFGPYQPTHWMPLPAAPVVTQEGEEPCP
jgi:hypothetical protein